MLQQKCFALVYTFALVALGLATCTRPMAGQTMSLFRQLRTPEIEVNVLAPGGAVPGPAARATKSRSVCGESHA